MSASNFTETTVSESFSGHDSILHFTKERIRYETSRLLFLR